MPAQPEKGLHANRSHSAPTAGGKIHCFSRTAILTGRTPAAFGSTQNMTICVDGEKREDPTTWPKLWPRAGRVLKVPKVVILSSLPFWTAWWKSCYFYGPRDVIGIDPITGKLGNYYYLEQWNDVDPDTSIPPDVTFAQGNPNYDTSLGPQATQQYAANDPGYMDNQVWRNFDKSLTDADKTSVYNLQASCFNVAASDAESTECGAIPAYLYNLCTQPPEERFSQIVGRVESPYYQLHRQITDAFLKAKEILESDPVDPIYVIIPEWMPTQLYQIRNAFLKKQHQKLNAAHGGVPNQRPCDVSDSVPCYDFAPVCWAPAYPDKDDPRNQSGFITPTVPWLASTHPGFGTDVLHLYVGHPCMKYFASSSTWDFQAWPLTPEVQWIAGPVFQGAYLGSDLPFFAGRRAIWESRGFDYGYTGGITPASLYDTRYGAIVEAAAGQYKQEFYNYRNFTTRLFTYPAQWAFQWDLRRIFRDQEKSCPTLVFWFGFHNFEDYVSILGPDTSAIDCSDAGTNPTHLKLSEEVTAFPDTPSLKDAVENFYPPIQRRIEEYYNSIEPGSAAFYELCIERNDLAKYNVSYEGSLPGALLDADGIVEYVRAYFAGKEPRG